MVVKNLKRPTLSPNTASLPPIVSITACLSITSNAFPWYARILMVAYCKNNSTKKADLAVGFSVFYDIVLLSINM